MIDMRIYKPVSTVEKNKKNKHSILDELMVIGPHFDYPDVAKDSFELYLCSVKKLIYRVLPKEVLELGSEISSFSEKEKIKLFYEKILSEVPIISWSEDPSQAKSVISISTLCTSNHSHGVGRFLGDVFSRWLVPGKQLPLVYFHSTAFRFNHAPLTGYFIHETFVKVDNKKDFILLYANIENLAREIKLNILSVQHARKVISIKPLTLDQKKIIIQENINSLLNRPSIDIDHSIFDQMQHFFVKVSAEERVTRIKELITPLLDFRPQVFERDVFNDLQKFISLYKNTFTATRELRHLTRIIAYKYLFRKVITHAILQDPSKRHVHMKICSARIKIKDESRKVLGIILGINLLSENEIFEEKHILTAIQSILPKAEVVAESYITDKRSDNNIRIVYLEIFNPPGHFSGEAIKALRAFLSKEIKMRIESVMNPIFFLRNEEEVMRNILILSKQLTFVRDIPQVIISFHKQEEELISFTVILVKIVTSNDTPLQDSFARYKDKIKFSDHEIKAVGFVRKKHKKEAHVFDMHLPKNIFLRKDFSVDLNEARKYVFQTLTTMFGNLRDYNGGMISKQSEALAALKKLLLQMNINNDFLLETFFYSLSPKYMQSIHQPQILKNLFLLVLEMFEQNYNEEPYQIKTQIVDDHLLITIGALNPSFKTVIEQQIENLELEPSALTSSYMNIYDISCLSFILKFKDSDEHQKFLQIVVEAIKYWKDTLQKSLPSSFFPEFF